MTSNRRAGITLIVAAIAIVGVMITHPTGRDAAGAGHGLSTIVHAVAIIAELALLLGLLGLTAHLREQRDLAIAAFVTYAAATMSLVVAAIAAGWIEPPVAGTLNHSFATVGYGLTGIAIVLWSIAIWSAQFPRPLSVLGVASGVLILFGLAHHPSLQMHGFGGVATLLMVVWFGWTGILLSSRNPVSPQ
jgi:hypothetical protein